MNHSLARSVRLGWLLAMLAAAMPAPRMNAAPPLVIDDGHGLLTTAAVTDLCALAATPTRLGDPAVIHARTSSADGSTVELRSATVYLAPSEAGAHGCRGSYLECYPVSAHQRGDEFYHWREAGKWMVGGTVASGEYLLLAAAGKELPMPASSQFPHVDPAHLVSALDLQSILALVDTARNFRLRQPDNTELPLAELKIISVRTFSREGESIGATVAFQPPLGQEPISAKLRRQPNQEWQVTGIQRRVYF